MATEKQVKEFIETIGPMIQKYAKSMGLHVASPIIAQACCESAYGTSWISKAPYFNYFGMKCGSSWKGRSVSAKTKEEYSAGTLTSITANFRAYDDMESGVAGYFSFISAPRYAALKTCATPEAYLTAIKVAGYATSFSYVNTNLQIIDRYDLRRFDWETEKAPDDFKPYGVYQNGSTAEVVYADSAMTKSIGELVPREKCDYLGTVDGAAIVCYTVGSTKHRKVGFVRWLGGIKK